jgi:hypothetical protein
VLSLNLRLTCSVDTLLAARQVWLALSGVRIGQWPAFASANGRRDRPVLAQRRADQDASWPAGYFGLVVAGSLARAWSSWPRELMASLAKTLPR